MVFPARLAAVLLSCAPCTLACERSQAAPAEGVSGTVTVTVDDKGFTPSSIEAKKGAPVSLRFLRTTDDTCAKAVVFPDLGLTKDLPLDVPVNVDLPTDTARTLTFQCGMGMFKSKLVVR
jgi:plastocyanin domain-containing protein